MFERPRGHSGLGQNGRSGRGHTALPRYEEGQYACGQNDRSGGGQNGRYTCGVEHAYACSEKRASRCSQNAYSGRGQSMPDFRRACYGGGQDGQYGCGEKRACGGGESEGSPEIYLK